MERIYKKYQFTDVPIPRTTAYRQRKKQRLDEEMDLREEASIIPSNHEKGGQRDVVFDSPQGIDPSSELFEVEENTMYSIFERDEVIGSYSPGSVDSCVTDPRDGRDLIVESGELSLDCDIDENAVDTRFIEENRSRQHVEKDSTLFSLSDNDVSDTEPFVLEESDKSTPRLLSETLCRCTSTTVGDGLLMCLALSFRHHLTWVALVDTLHLINSLYNKTVIPASKYFFLKHMDKENESVAYHIYCPTCEAYLGIKNDLFRDVITCECGQEVKVSSAVSFFLSIGLEKQLKDLLSKPEIAEALNYRFDRVKPNDDALSDIYDGAVYQNLAAPGGILSSPLNFSYTFNTDGIPFGKSSKKTIWPIYLTINELPPNERAKHMLLAGIWVGDKDPNMTIFLKPFVDYANVLSTEGLTWICDGKEVNSKIIPLCAVVDSVARCKMLNMKQFNSFYGCTLCYQKTERTDKGRRFTIPNRAAPCRTHDGTVEDMIKAHTLRNEKDEKERVIKGVKGPSALIALLYFNIILGMVPDYMHAILLGVIRYHMELLFTSVGKKYYIGLTHTIAAINERMSKIRPPRSITRTPRSFNDRSLWRASEWRSWLIFYCVPCLEGILKPKYVKHIGMLSAAVNILLQKSVTQDEISTAHNLLMKYIHRFENYFGASSMVYNVHLLTHLAQGVRNWGPLWTRNCFSFEGQSRHLLQLTKSPAHVAKEVVRKFLTFSSLPILCDMYASTDACLDFCESISGKSFKFLVRSNGVVLPEKGTLNCLNDDEQICVKDLGWNPSEVKSFQRMICGHIRYCTWAYASGKKTNDSVVCVRDRLFGKIESIVVAENNVIEVFVLLREIIVEERPMFGNADLRLTHIKKIVAEGKLVAVSPRDIDSQCVIMSLDTGDFICKMPYGCYGD